MEHELHERIMLFLFEHRNTNNSYDLLQEFKDDDSDLVTERAQYLYNQKYIHAFFPSGFGLMNLQTGEYTHGMSISDSISARILPAGIDYVKKELMKNDKQESIKVGDISHSVVQIGNKAGDQSSITSSQKNEIEIPKANKTSTMKKIFILVAAGVLTTIILYLIFGAKVFG